MRLCLDIGGVISKYPDQFKKLLLLFPSNDIFVITDMHKKEEVLQMLENNGFGFIPENNIYCADYKSKGEFCKALLLKELKIDIFIDDFGGYLQWDSILGDAPIRLLVVPDGFKPYWAPEWKVDVQQDFGRRLTSVEVLNNAVK
ncbi:MAG: hypothetical protein WCO84_06260 [bacterium]